MCGIVGAISNKNIVPNLIEGLSRLEYRGYDSSGIAVLRNGIERVRSVGRVAEIETRTDEAVEQLERHRLVRGPAEHVAAEHQRRHGVQSNHCSGLS